MFGAKNIKEIINLGSEVRSKKCPYTEQKEAFSAGLRQHQSRTIAANWNALSYRHNPSPAVHVPAVLPVDVAARPIILSETELDAAAFLERATMLRSYKLRARGKPRHARERDGVRKVVKPAAKVGGVHPSQLWPSEAKAAAGFQIDSSDKRRFASIDWSLASLAQLTASRD